MGQKGQFFNISIRSETAVDEGGPGSEFLQVCTKF